MKCSSKGVVKGYFVDLCVNVADGVSGDDVVFAAVQSCGMRVEVLIKTDSSYSGSALRDVG